MKKLLFTLLIIVSSITIKAQDGLSPKRFAFDVSYMKIAPDMIDNNNSRKGVKVSVNKDWLHFDVGFNQEEGDGIEVYRKDGYYKFSGKASYVTYNIGINILLVKGVVFTPKIGMVCISNIYQADAQWYKEESYTKYDVSIDLKMDLFNPVYVVIGTGVTQKFCYGLGINF